MKAEGIYTRTIHSDTMGITGMSFENKIPDEMIIKGGPNLQVLIMTTIFF